MQSFETVMEHKELRRGQSHLYFDSAERIGKARKGEIANFGGNRKDESERKSRILGYLEM